MDGISCYTNKFDDHIEQLKFTLSTPRENRFSCNPKKTELACSRTEYLGFVLSADGIQMSEKRIEAIGKITAPRNVKELQRILGLFNFWRKYVPSYSRNSFHVRQLLRKDVKFQWTKECDKEPEYLKEAPTKLPISRPIDPRLPIYVQVDDSKQGYGAAILPRDANGNFYVIQYGAKAQIYGLAIGGTGLCSYRVRGVGGSCAEHLTVESYTIIISLHSYLYRYSITHSLFHSRLKSFLFCKSSLPQPFLFLLHDSLFGFPRLFTVTSEHIRLFTF